ncbi:MAG: hypothetical protein QNL88_17360 [Acidobacteriota bacterium]|nr:hypothetical protein [Acidobacteriota bacterium]
MNNRLATAVIIAAAACGACTSDVDIGGGVRQRGDYQYFYEGPELEATVGTYLAATSIGENWLVLALYLRATSPSGNLVIERKAVSVVTPDGHRLPLISQEEFRAAYSQIHSLVRRTDFAAPSSRAGFGDLRYCDRWFFAEVGEGYATEELFLVSAERCSGPLVFNVPRGIQPGRWRLVIELEESSPDIPFEVSIER